MRIVKTQTSDGYHFSGLLSEAKDSKKIIIHIHGMAGSIVLEEYYEYMHDYYPKNGYSFLAGEHRGTGTMTGFIHEPEDIMGGNAFEKFEDCIYDIQAWVDLAKENGYEEIWLQGHSLGPSKIAYYINQKGDESIKGLIFLSPADMIGLVHDEAGQKDHDILLPEAKKLVNDGRGQTILSHTLWEFDLLSAETYLSLFGDNAKTGIFNYANDSFLSNNRDKR